jgi:transketolase
MNSIRFVPAAEIDRLRGALTDPIRSCQALAAACRLNALSMIAYAGSGHIGTSFSSMDLFCWLWTQELRNPSSDARGDGDLFFSSKGHDVPGLYALLIALRRMSESCLTGLRRLGGLPGHPDVGVPYMITNTGSLGMGISKARGFAIANRLNGVRSRIFVLTGDGELQEGQFWESLQPTANGRFSEITVIVDHNKLQSDRRVADVSDLGDLLAKVRAFGWAVERCDGHDFQAIAASLARLSAAGERPRLLIADTVKGKGVSFMEADTLRPGELFKFHSGAPSAEHYAAAAAELAGRADGLLAEVGASPLRYTVVPAPARVAPPSPQRLVSAYAEELVALGGVHENLVALDADLVVDCGVLPFQRAFPERFIECGIAEQDMVSQAGALALKGKLPVVHSFACFLSTRPNEQLYNNASERTKIVYAASLAGLLPAGPGHSHQSVRDISAVGSIPGLTLLQPCNEAETRLALRWAVEENPQSTYLRLSSMPWTVPFELPPGYALRPGRGVVLRDGRDAAVFAYGPVMLAEAYRAADLLADAGCSVAVVNLPWLNRVDREWLAETVRGRRRLFLIEDHYVEFGQGVTVTWALSQLGVSIPTHIFGLEDIPVCAQPAEALDHHGLSGARLAERIRAEL